MFAIHPLATYCSHITTLCKVRAVALATTASPRRPDADPGGECADTEADALWRQHELTGDANPLLLHYWALVDQVAGRVGGDLPSFVDRADLVSYGFLGLIDAVEKFDPDRGARFETYAAVRVRGAILDGLRSIDWVPRSVRRGIRDVARAEGALQMTLHRRPTEGELAVRLGITIASLRKRSADDALSRVVPLDDLRYVPRVERAESAAALSRTDQPGHALEAAERRGAVTQAIDELCDRDRTVIDLYYNRGLTLSQIGRVLGVTEARVSQLHTRARSALKKTLLGMDI